MSKKEPAQVLDRVVELLNEQTTFGWKIQNLLAFMAEALPDDELSELPVKCALIGARDDMYKLVVTLMDIVHRAEHG
jgi:hypothetical protein